MEKLIMLTISIIISICALSTGVIYVYFLIKNWRETDYILKHCEYMQLSCFIFCLVLSFISWYAYIFRC